MASLFVISYLDALQNGFATIIPRATTNLYEQMLYSYFLKQI
jgi:hypothetical protein|uniref:Uncharacterized protein n=1 Tax=Sphingobacterium sp. (strain 21) TaxID=743722 RepID=F4C5I5_SPHS2